MLVDRNRFTYSGLTVENKCRETAIDIKSGLENRSSDRKVTTYQDSKQIN